MTPPLDLDFLQLSPSMNAAAKPAFALVLPPHFRRELPEHLAELEAILPLVRSFQPNYRVQLVPDAGPQRVQQTDWTAFSFAIVLLDRQLAEALATKLPTRLVGTSPVAFTPDKWRITFTDPSRLTGTRSTPVGSGVLFLDPAFPPDALAAHRTKLKSLRVLHARGCDATWIARAATALERPAEEFAPATLEDFTAELEQFISTDPLALRLARAAHRTLLTPSSGFLQLGEQAQPEDLYLFKGEDLDGLRLRDRIAGLRSPPLRSRTLTEPLISLVIPVYDRDEELLRLARSIAAQSYRAMEVLFVTNGSPAPTLEALRRCRALLVNKRIRVEQIDFPQAFGCATVPRDVGVYAARGELICFIDSDDYFEPAFFDRFASRPVETDVIYSPFKVFRNGGRPMGPEIPFDVPVPMGDDVQSGLFELLMTRGNIFNNSGVVISRDLFVAAGGIRHELRYCEDYYLWLRMAKLGARAHNFPGQVSITLHPGNNELNVGDPKWLDIARRAAERGNLL